MTTGTMTAHLTITHAMRLNADGSKHETLCYADLDWIRELQEKVYEERDARPAGAPLDDLFVPTLICEFATVIDGERTKLIVAHITRLTKHLDGTFRFEAISIEEDGEMPMYFDGFYNPHTLRGYMSEVQHH